MLLSLRLEPRFGALGRVALLAAARGHVSQLAAVLHGVGLRCIA